jgi:hypothetical protein
LAFRDKLHQFLKFSIFANTAVAIFRGNVYWGVLKALYRLGSRWDVKDMNGGTEE